MVGAAILFLILQRRHVRKTREEDANDPTTSMDFGLGHVPGGMSAKGKKGPNNINTTDMREKGIGHQRQVSLDVTSPYLLPPELHSSRESLHSLSRIHANEDPYRPVSSYLPNDASSIRSYSRPGRDGSSIYTGHTTSSGTPSRFRDTSKAELLSNAVPMARSPTTFIPPPRQNSLPQSKVAVSPVDSLSNPLPTPPPPYPVEPPQVHLPEPVTQAGIQNKGLPTSPRPNGLSPVGMPAVDSNSSTSNDHSALRQSNNYLGPLIDQQDPSQTPTPPLSRPTESMARKSPPPLAKSLPANPRPVRKESIPAVEAPSQTFMDDESDYGDGLNDPLPPPIRINTELVQGQRHSLDVRPEQFPQTGLGSPGFDPRRISMGVRPLPPNEITENEDPEIRANRIRSFYKEYFDDSKPGPQAQYYEDYDQNYLGDAAYYDPETNNFVMPYAQPVTRRAMTPPPRGPRFLGPPRGMHGSVGAISTGGIPGRGMHPPGPRAYSSVSGRIPPPGPRRPLPPPAALSSLPTPAKLRDDSFALMNATDFAPPQSYRERVAGRSESPIGERRPYSPMVPAHVPLASAFDELAPMPSP